VVTSPTSAREVLDRAHAARSAGRGPEAARLYDEAIGLCRDANDLPSWVEAALGAASVYVFGAEPGRLPAQLYDLLARVTDDASQARLGAALARCWAYSGQADRAARFADDAVRAAERDGSAELVVDCLDAALAAHWGPDDLEARRHLAAHLDDVAAHVLDHDARLQAHLWGLQIACESLDLPAMHRQIRAIELLGEESARARFFAASRRQMLDLLRGRTDTHERLHEIAADAASAAGLADAWMVLVTMDGYAAAHRGDSATCAATAAKMEAFAMTEGGASIVAETAFAWICAGDLDRARIMVGHLHGRVLDELPRDVNWLLALQCTLEAALAVDEPELVQTAARLLSGYEGRAVFNAGAVMFHGVTDDPLSRAAAVAGDAETSERLRASALATYERIGAQWWRDRLLTWTPPPAPLAALGGRRVHLRPDAGGVWLIGVDGSSAPVRPLRGFDYLRRLVERPGQALAALDLVGAGSAVVVEPDMGELADRQALQSYRSRLRDLDDELAEAEAWSDAGRIASAHAEREALLAELARTTGLGGRPRVAGGSDERARVAVKKAISAALDRIATVDADLAAHLRASIRTGVRCSYEPAADDRIDWVTG
jgi:hypothetical protein